MQARQRVMATREEEKKAGASGVFSAGGEGGRAAVAEGATKFRLGTHRGPATESDEMNALLDDRLVDWKNETKKCSCLNLFFKQPFKFFFFFS
jgi:hypothetical protein